MDGAADSKQTDSVGHHKCCDVRKRETVVDVLCDMAERRLGSSITQISHWQ